MAEIIGRALHAAKRVGGPWGAPCGRVKEGIDYPYKIEHFELVDFGYDSGEYECECPQQGVHLLELMEKEYASYLPSLQAPRREQDSAATGASSRRGDTAQAFFKAYEVGTWT